MANFHDIDPDPNAPARCPRQLVGEGPRCKALVLVRDAAEHEAFHDRLDELLTAPVDTSGGVDVAQWPQLDEAPEPAPMGL